MQTFERETVVDAPLDEVWAFHSTIDGLRALTPTWLALRIESIDSPRDQNPGALVAGTTIYGSVAPFWVLPRQYWSSTIEARSEFDDECSFVDTMDDGPIPRWEHTHRFVSTNEGTRIVDHVEFEPPGGALGRFVLPVLLRVFFAYRHWRTREILEDA